MAWNKSFNRDISHRDTYETKKEDVRHKDISGKFPGAILTFTIKTLDPFNATSERKASIQFRRNQGESI